MGNSCSSNFISGTPKYPIVETVELQKKKITLKEIKINHEYKIAGSRLPSSGMGEGMFSRVDMVLKGDCLVEEAFGLRQNSREKRLGQWKPSACFEIKEGHCHLFNLQPPIYLPSGVFLTEDLFQSYWQRLKISPMKFSLSPFFTHALFTIMHTEDRA